MKYKYVLKSLKTVCLFLSDLKYYCNSIERKLNEQYLAILLTLFICKNLSRFMS